MDEGDAGFVTVPIVWNAPEDVPILTANTFVCQFDSQDSSGLFILTAGQLTPPALVGTPDEVEQQAREVSFVPVKPILRLGLTPFRLRELVAVLQANLDNWERARTMRQGDPR